MCLVCLVVCIASALPFNYSDQISEMMSSDPDREKALVDALDILSTTKLISSGSRGKLTYVKPPLLVDQPGEALQRRWGAYVQTGI